MVQHKSLSSLDNLELLLATATTSTTSDTSSVNLHITSTGAGTMAGTTISADTGAIGRGVTVSNHFSARV